MSWSKVLAVTAALSLAGGLSGCFQPLYSEAAHPGLVDDLHGIEVAPIPNRVGHYLGENLIADLNGTGQTASPPKYRLTVTVSLGTQTPTVNSEINVASSATVTGEATYVLTKVDGGKEVLKGTANAVAACTSIASRMRSGSRPGSERSRRKLIRLFLMPGRWRSMVYAA